jgi:hypothetical protein
VLLLLILVAWSVRDWNRSRSIASEEPAAANPEPVPATSVEPSSDASSSAPPAGGVVPSHPTTDHAGPEPPSKPGAPIASAGTPPPAAPAYPQWALGPAGESATIALSPEVTLRFRLVSRNATGLVWPFKPYFISLDPVPNLALQLLMPQGQGVLTALPPGAQTEAPLEALWYPDARALSEMLCGSVPTHLDWINAVLTETIDPGEETELAFNPRFGGVLSQVSAAGKVVGPYVEMKDRRFGLNAYPEGSARQRGLGPPKGRLRLVAPGGEAFLRCRGAATLKP